MRKWNSWEACRTSPTEETQSSSCQDSQCLWIRVNYSQNFKFKNVNVQPGFYIFKNIYMLLDFDSTPKVLPFVVHIALSTCVWQPARRCKLLRNSALCLCKHHGLNHTSVWQSCLTGQGGSVFSQTVHLSGCSALMSCWSIVAPLIWKITDVQRRFFNPSDISLCVLRQEMSRVIMAQMLFPLVWVTL